MKQFVIDFAGDDDYTREEGAQPKLFLVSSLSEALQAYAEERWRASTALDQGEHYFVTEVGQPTKRIRIQSAGFRIVTKEVK